MTRLIARSMAAVGSFLLWGARFGIYGDDGSRSFRAACWTTLYLSLLVFTLASVVTFYSAGVNFAGWIDAFQLCGRPGDGHCRNQSMIELALFVIPPFIFSMHVRRRYAQLVGDRAHGPEYFLYPLLGVGFMAIVLALFWRSSATVSLLMQIGFWSYFFQKGKDLDLRVSSPKARG